jgi:hypothetical protein
MSSVNVSRESLAVGETMRLYARLLQGCERELAVLPRDVAVTSMQAVGNTRNLPVVKPFTRSTLHG